MINQTKSTVTTGLEQRITACQTSLSALKWLTKAFGRAWLLPYGRENKRQPMVYTGKKDYESVLPNDKYNAFSFFIGSGAAVATDSEEAYVQSAYYQKSVDLIFYMNLKKIDPSQDYYFIEQLNNEILATLARCQGVQVDEIWLEDIRDVYAGFDIDETANALLYYPYSGIRYKLLVTYKENC